MNKKNEKNSQLEANELSDDDLGSVAGGVAILLDNGDKVDLGNANGIEAKIKLNKDGSVSFDIVDPKKNRRTTLNSANDERQRGILTDLKTEELN